MNEPSPAIIALEDGTVLRGTAFGAEGEATGEVVFNTSMTGYQEILTDPSYCGQIVAMTCPEIGNVGVNAEDDESRRPFLSAFVVREHWDRPSSWRASGTLASWMRDRGVVGISGVDTRALVRHIRDAGAMRAIVSTTDLDPDRLVRKARESPEMEGRDLVGEVTTEEVYEWTDGVWHLGRGYRPGPEPRRHVVAYDFGMKRNILRNLASLGCRVTVVPASTTADEVLALEPDGVFLSNGPGDPEPVRYAAENVAKLVGRTPIFGICLGHQILGLALGGRTYKLKFGHHGGNQPVMDLSTDKVEITSQNHGFAVDVDSLQGRAQLTHVNLNDRTVEGLAVPSERLFSVQYHPEASPGPHDANYLFARFVDLMEGGELRGVDE